MSGELSVCGVECAACDYLKKGECRGCAAIQGKVFWAGYTGAEICPVFACVAGKGLSDCGKCPELPCRLWRELKDPNYTDEQHEAGIRERVEKLRQR
jgi:hypothetical protein